MKFLGIVFNGLLVVVSQLLQSNLLGLIALIFIAIHFCLNIDFTRRPLVFAVFVLTFLVPFSVLVKYEIFDYTADSWRIAYRFSESFSTTMTLLIAYVYLFYASTCVLVRKKYKFVLVECESPLFLDKFRGLLKVFVVLVLLVYIAEAAKYYGMTRHDMLVGNIESGGKLFELFLMVFPVVILLQGSGKKIYSVFFYTLAIFALVLLALGERTKFLTIALGGLLYLKNRHALPEINATKMLLSFTALYFVFVFVSVLRLEGLSVESFVYVAENYTSEDYLQVFGNHEENIYFSMVAMSDFVKNSGVLYGGTYLDSFVRILPDFVINIFSMEKPERVSVRIADIINPGVFQSLGLSYGAFYLVEVFWNFGHVGVVAVAFLVPLLLSRLDDGLWTAEGKGRYLNLMHTIFFINVVSFVYYGSPNYVNMVFYSIFFAVIYFGSGRVLARVGV